MRIFRLLLFVHKRSFVDNLEHGSFLWNSLGKYRDFPHFPHNPQVDNLMELRKIFSSFFQNDVIVHEPKLFFRY